MTLVQLVGSKANAYILPLDFILQKSASLAGNSIIGIEQEVQYREGSKVYSVKESWIIEGDRNLRVTVRGQGELKEAVNMTLLYNNKNRTVVTANNKTVKSAGADFFERYLAVKSKDSFKNYMKELGIGEDVRLSRAAGQVCFAVGNISTENDLQPHLWIDQNSFRLAKIRMPSDAEIEFNDYIEKDGVHYPLTKTVTWQGKTVTIKVNKVNTKSKAKIEDFYPDKLEASQPVNLGNFGLAGSVLDEFYQRFR